MKGIDPRLIALVWQHRFDACAQLVACEGIVGKHPYRTGGNPEFVDKVGNTQYDRGRFA